jgi:hypothetical protein
MTTRTDRYTRNEKIGLTLLALAFCFTEGRSIKQYSAQYEYTQNQTKIEQSARFENITFALRNIPGQSQSNLAQSNLAGTESRTRIAPDSIAGVAEIYKPTSSVAERGVLFPYFIGRRIDTPSSSADRWQLIVMNPSNTPLFDVTALVRRRTPSQDTFPDVSTKPNAIMSLKIPTVQPTTQGPFDTARFLPPGSYSIDIATRDNRFVELLDILADPHAPGGFSEHYRIYRQGSSQLLFSDGNPVNTVLQ